ncbi:AAA family ATPase [Streptomyces sp. NPDC088097]|uniref:AAA family ATPase n=1 Tax=Streptomyces sp. NPDC088097 TaxID=3365823 RepID=UPI0037F3BA28
MKRRIVMVTGAPAAGKSTLAGPLALELGFPLLSKDHIKETLHDCLGTPDGAALAASGRLGAATMELIWALAARCPAAVIEANFLPRHPETRPRLAALAADVVEVHCHCPLPEAARRFTARAADSGHHPVHIRSLPEHVLAEYDRPLEVGPVIRVDTTRPTDLAVLGADVRRAFTAG